MKHFGPSGPPTFSWLWRGESLNRNAIILQVYPGMPIDCPIWNVSEMGVGEDVYPREAVSI